MSQLTKAAKQAHLQQIIDVYFNGLIDKEIYSVIYNDEYEIVTCTQHSAHSVGFSQWQEAIGYSFKNYNNLEHAKLLFKDAYYTNTPELIHSLAKRIYEIQQHVINHNKVTNYIDLLPYNNQFKTFLVTLVPLTHPNGEVIGMQSFSVESRFFCFQDQLNSLLAADNRKVYTSNAQEFSPREQEVLFLLANGLTQEQTAQLIKVSRSTIASIIGNLCYKFKIPGSNTKALAMAAIKHQFYANIPPSLWQPNVIILDEDLAKSFTA